MQPSDPAESDGANRRSADRFDVTWKVDCETEDTFLYAAITNISAMGIFVMTDSPLAVGTELALRFSPLGEEEFLLDGVVQWINPKRNNSPNPGMGIRFAHLTPDDRERLVHVIRTISYLFE